MLRLTTQRVRLCVFRHQETYREEDLWDVFSVELKTRPGEGLGLTTVGKWYAYHAKKKKKINPAAHVSPFLNILEVEILVVALLCVPRYVRIVKYRLKNEKKQEVEGRNTPKSSKTTGL